MLPTKKSKRVISVLVLSALGVGLYGLTENDESGAREDVSTAKAVVTPSVAILPPSALGSVSSSSVIARFSREPVPAADEDFTALFEQDDPNPNFDSFYDRYQSTVARRPNMKVNPQALFDAAQSPNAWQESDAVAESSELAGKYKNDGRTFITLSNLKLESLAAGDKLEIAIANTDINFTATISDVRSDPSGQSVTWSGSSDTPGSTETITITQGDSLTVGGIFTEQGLYQLEVKNGQGYIVSSATLFRHGQDQQVQVPQHLIENPPEYYVKLDAETFGN